MWGLEEDSTSGGSATISYEACEEQARGDFGLALKLMQARDYAGAKDAFDALYGKFAELLPDSPFRSRMLRALLKNTARCLQELGVDDDGGNAQQQLRALVMATQYTTHGSGGCEDEQQDVSLWMMLRRCAKQCSHVPLFHLADSVLRTHQHADAYVAVEPPKSSLEEEVVAVVLDDAAIEEEDSASVVIINVASWHDLVHGLERVLLTDRVQVSWGRHAPPPVPPSPSLEVSAAAALLLQDPSSPSGGTTHSNSSLPTTATPSSVRRLQSITRSRRNRAAAALNAGNNVDDDDNTQQSFAADTATSAPSSSSAAASLEELMPEAPQDTWKEMVAWFKDRTDQRGDSSSSSTCTSSAGGQQQQQQHLLEIRFKSTLLEEGLFKANTTTTTTAAAPASDDDDPSLASLRELVVNSLSSTLLASEAIQRCIDYISVHFRRVPLLELSSFYVLCVQRRFALRPSFQWLGALSLLAPSSGTSNSDELERFVLQCALDVGDDDELCRELAVWTLKRSEERGYFLRNFALVELSVAALERCGEQYGGGPAYVAQARARLESSTKDNHGLWALDQYLPTSGEFSRAPERSIRKGMEICFQTLQQQQQQQQQASASSYSLLNQYLFQTALHLINTRQEHLLRLLLTLAQRRQPKSSLFPATAATLDPAAAEYLVCRVLGTFPALGDLLPGSLGPYVQAALPSLWVWCAETKFAAGIEWLKKTPALSLAAATSAAPAAATAERYECMLVAMMQTKAYACLMHCLPVDDKVEVCAVLVKLDDSLSRDMLKMLLDDASAADTLAEKNEEEEEEEDRMHDSIARERLMCQCAQWYLKPDNLIPDEDLALVNRFCAAHFWCKGGSGGAGGAGGGGAGGGGGGSSRQGMLKLQEKRALAERLVSSPALPCELRPWFHLVHMYAKRSELGAIQFKQSTDEDFEQLEDWLKQEEDATSTSPPAFLSRFLQLKLDFHRHEDTADLLGQVRQLEALRDGGDAAPLSVGCVVVLEDHRRAVVSHLIQDDGGGEVFCDVVTQRTASHPVHVILRRVPASRLRLVTPHGSVSFLPHDYDVFEEFDEYACVVRHRDPPSTVHVVNKLQQQPAPPPPCPVEEAQAHLAACRRRFPHNWQFAWLQGAYEDALRMLRLRSFDAGSGGGGGGAADAASAAAKKAAAARRFSFEYERDVAISDVLCRLGEFREALQLNPANLRAALDCNTDAVLDNALQVHYNSNKRLKTSWFVWEEMEAPRLMELVDKCVMARFALLTTAAGGGGGTAPAAAAVARLFEFCRTKKLNRVAQEISKYLVGTVMPTLRTLHSAFEVYSLLKAKDTAIRRKFEAHLLDLGRLQLGSEAQLPAVLEHCRAVMTDGSGGGGGSSAGGGGGFTQRPLSKMYKQLAAAAVPHMPLMTTTTATTATHVHRKLLMLLSVQRIHRLGAGCPLHRLSPQDIKRVGSVLM